MKKIFSAILLVILALLFYKGAIYLIDNKISNIKEPAEVYVRPGDSPEDVLAALISSLRRPRSLKRMFKAKEVEKYMQPGHYSFGKDAGSVFIARSLNNGWQTPVSLTLSGALRGKGEIARKISAQMMLDSASVAAALSDAELLDGYGFTPRTAFSLFVPDTYQIYWTASAEEIFEIQKRAYDAFWTKENLAKAEALGLTPLQVSTLASIVKGESKLQKDFSRIAGVYLARLRKGMPLQADPTVAFIFDYEPGRILKKHLRADSPYNTYKHKGLPPGPICVPDKPYLDAVLNPSLSEGYLYFCASPAMDGSHLFARTYSEHLRNARAFQKALDALSRSKL